MTADEELAERLAWKTYAEACCQHDCDTGRRACEELKRLVPEQRTDS